MPFVAGFLKAVKRPGKPGQPLPPGEGGPPDWGLEGPEVEPPDIDRPPFEKPLPTPPPGVWPGPSVELPYVPVPPDVDAEPGTIWPSPGEPGHPLPSQKFWLLVLWNNGYYYICVDPSLIPRPMPPMHGGGGSGQPPVAQPK